MFETVVLGTDGSPHAAAATDAAIDVTDRFDADLHAVAALAPDAADDREAALETALAAVADRTDRSVTTAIRSGTPPTVIRAYAVECGADLIVVGTRGRGGGGEFHLGSTAETVVHEAPMPVLTVRGAGDSGAGDDVDTATDPTVH